MFLNQVTHTYKCRQTQSCTHTCTDMRTHTYDTTIHFNAWVFLKEKNILKFSKQQTYKLVKIECYFVFNLKKKKRFCFLWKFYWNHFIDGNLLNHRNFTPIPELWTFCKHDITGHFHPELTKFINIARNKVFQSLFVIKLYVLSWNVFKISFNQQTTCGGDLMKRQEADDSRYQIIIANQSII